MKLRARLRLWRKRHKEVRELKSLEAYLFNHGPITKWREVRNSNIQLGVWDGTYKKGER